MCGIALIVSGVQIEVGNLVSEFVSPLPLPPKEELFSIDDIKFALHRRGPDSIESKKVLICAKKSLSSVREEDSFTSFIHEVDAARTDGNDVDLHIDEESCEIAEDCSYGVLGELYFIGATLQLRGTYPISQPLMDASGNVLVYNGEIFGGVNISCDSNDGESLMQLLGQCCSCRSIDHGPSCSGQDSVPQLLSRIKGPWALIYWQNSSKILWFGRDAFGRRSLLVHWPTPGDSRLVLSTVSPISSKLIRSDIGEEQGENKLGFWEELSCGVYSMSINDAKKDAYLSAEVKRHPWTDDNLEKLIDWKRTHVQPMPADLRILRGCDTRNEECVHSADTDDTHSELGFKNVAFLLPPQRVLVALKEAVFRRTALCRIYKCQLDYGIEGYAPIAVLFSGGLDSMILAALLDQCLDPKYEIDLLNVSFDGPCAPDRITARAGLKELVKIAPSRRWNLVEINADLQSLTSETSHVMSLIAPAKTYMDLNIGVALWLAARGDGCLYEDHQDLPLVKFKSKSKILLVGSGADEQCAGYGRHRTKYRLGSWLALNEEMQLDMQRIWKRNLGRDDRCIADNGKEARFPFLDEDVIRTMLDIPLWEIADLDQPSGIGDKKILRKVAKMLGLSGAAVLPKRAIQFGTRIARESNRKNFGSNRAANQASAGSVEILLLHGPS